MERKGEGRVRIEDAPNIWDSRLVDNVHEAKRRADDAGEEATTMTRIIKDAGREEAEDAAQGKRSGANRRRPKSTFRATNLQ